MDVASSFRLNPSLSSQSDLSVAEAQQEPDTRSLLRPATCESGQARPHEREHEIKRNTADEWQEESNRQAHDLKKELAATPSSAGFFGEFRRKLAAGEGVSRALVKLAEALRFTGRITITFHQGKVTKTVFEESYFSGGGT